MRFKIGDIVKWSSHSQGSWKEKVGRVAAVIPAKVRPEQTDWPQLYKGCGPGYSRDHETYIVTVGTRVYWPRTSALKLAE